MNKRLQQFLAAENISQAQFADTIEVARASVSHVLAGRNKPGYDFIKSITDHYPTLSLDWLINGKGKMYRETAMRSEIPQSREDIVEDTLFKDEPDEEPEIKQAPHQEQAETVVSAPKPDSMPRSITRIVVFYDDNTYQELV
ncbi:MAG: helix-turn-helix transcriptional regulator [Bacteroidia bacterium]|nr:helix-turn-helix transcriptional regulator [Bacteroidia bacterium]